MSGKTLTPKNTQNTEKASSNSNLASSNQTQIILRVLSLVISDLCAETKAPWF